MAHLGEYGGYTRPAAYTGQSFSWCSDAVGHWDGHWAVV
jgi:hypothetical protein